MRATMNKTSKVSPWVQQSVGLALLALLAACSPSPPPATLPARIDHLEGRVVDRVDAPPYSYVQVETPDGLRWVGLPVDGYPKNGVVKVSGAALVGARRIGSGGRLLEGVYYGRLVSE